MDEADPAAEHAELIAIAAGDAEAFARLVNREAPRLLRFAFGILGRLEDAEDVVQDTLLRFLENAGSLRPDARIGTWLHTVCHNRAIDRLRRRRNLVSDSLLDDVADEAELPEAAMVRRQTAASVAAAIERLPHRQKAAVLLFHLQEMPQREAAMVMGISEDAFESLLARARRQMRRVLAAERGDDA